MKISKIIIITLLLFFIIGTVSASESNSTDTLTTENNVKEIYVNDTGDDLNTGSSLSPYATIGKAISDVNESDKATIHIGKGTFAADLDGNFDIDLNQRVHGGNLKFIGTGVNETFLDGQSTFRFAKLGVNTNITFKDITFINFKADNGGTLYSEGILTVDNCVFKDSYASGTNGGAIFSKSQNTSELYVTNCEFVSCSVNGKPGYWNSYDGGGAICTDNIYYAYIENNTFVNTSVNNELKGHAVNVHSTSDDEEEPRHIYTKSFIKGNRFVNITSNSKSFDAGLYVFSYSQYDYIQQTNHSFILNNEFINCYNPSEEYSIVYLKTGKSLFENNAFSNSTNANGNIFLADMTTIYGLQVNLVNEVNNITPYEINNGIVLILNITDDNGNIVKLHHDFSYPYTILSRTFFTVPVPGDYNLTFGYCGVIYYLANYSVVYDNSSVELWVSPEGFDGNQGTQDSPFESIGHAIDVGFEKSFNVTVHLLEGRYSGEGNVDLNLANRGSLQLIGEKYGGVIVDGENRHWFIQAYTNVAIKNMKFVKGYSETVDLITTRGTGSIVVSRSLILDHCIVDGCRVGDNYILSGASFNNLTYTNNVGQMIASDVINSHFENNTNPETPGLNNPDFVGGIIHYPGQVNIVNSSFINNSGYYGGVIWTNYGQITSMNSYYANNHAFQGGVFYIIGSSKFTSQNDTFINNSAVKKGVIGFRTDRTDSVSSNSNPNIPTFMIINGTFISNHAQVGGVMFIQKGTIENSSFINNSADYGGAIVVVPNKKTAVSSNKIDLVNLTFKDNSAKVNGIDIYLTTDVDPTWYRNQKLAFALPFNVTFNNLTTGQVSDYISVNIHGPLGVIIGGSIVNFKINNENVGYCEIINGNAKLMYNGFIENGRFSLSGDVDNMPKTSTVDDAIIIVNLTNFASNREVWVSTLGSDSDGDGSRNNPFKTIAHAIAESTKNCFNVVVHIECGFYSGELNTAFEVSSALNLTLKGENGTVIDGENTTWFVKILKGKNRITISGLTIKNMGLDNTKLQDEPSISLSFSDSPVPIIVDEGANLCLDNVLITHNHGGEAIIKNNGNLLVANSFITKNAFSSIAFVSGGHVTINNTIMQDNFGYNRFLACENCIITNSIIKNIFNLDGVFSLIEGDCVLENTIILNDGDNSSIKSLGIENSNISVVPALSFKNNLFMKNVSIINSYKSPIKIQETPRKDTYLAVMACNGAATQDGRNFVAIDCSFYNFKYFWVLNLWGDYNFTFERCLFKNITQISQTRAVGAYSKWIFTNCVFLDVDSYFQRPSYFITYNPTQISHNNGINDVPYDSNFWASNVKPVIRYADEDKIIFNYSPHNWIVLNNVNGVIKLQLTDGENTTDYLGDLPLNVYYAFDGEHYVPVIRVDGKSYPLSFEEDNIKIASNPIENVILKSVSDNTLFSEDLALNYGNKANFTARLLYPWGDPLANVNVTLNINDENFTVLTDENGIARLNTSFDCGVYDIIITNPVSGQVNINTLLINKADSRISVSNITAVYNDGKYLLVDLNGCDGNVSVVLNGKTITKVSEDGFVKIPISLPPKTYIAQITYDGDANHRPSAATAKITVKKATAKLTAKKATFKVKVKTKKYSIVLKDNNNKAIKKAKVILKVGKKTYKATTSAKGKATFKITKLTKKGKYAAKVAFAGNAYYNKVSKSVKITVKK